MWRNGKKFWFSSFSMQVFVYPAIVLSMCLYTMFCFASQPQLHNRSQRQNPTRTLQLNHLDTPPPHRRYPQEQDPYQTKATLLHTWTRARTVLVLLWPNHYTTVTIRHFARPLLCRPIKAWKPAPLRPITFPCFVSSLILSICMCVHVDIHPCERNLS